MVGRVVGTLVGCVVGRLGGRVGRNSYLTSPGKQPGAQGNSGQHAHLRLIIVLVPVFNHRASTRLPKSFSVDLTHSMCQRMQRRNIGWLTVQLATMCTAQQYVVSETHNSTYEG